MNGTLVDWADAKIHVALARRPLRQRRVRRRALLQHAARLGLLPARRAHAPAVRLREDLPDGAASSHEPALTDAVLETIRANEFKACYIRPIVYRGYHDARRQPVPLPGRHRDPDLGMGRLSRTGRARPTASTSGSARGRARRRTRSRRWRRPSANYANSQLIKMEAIVEGYSEGIALDTTGLPQRRQRPEPVPRARQRHLHAAARGRRSCRASRATRSSRSRAISASRCAKRCCRARCSTSPTRRSSSAPRPRSRRSASVDKITIGNGRRGPITEAHPAGVLRRHQRRGARSARLAEVRLPGRAAADRRRRRRGRATNQPRALRT